MNKSLNLPDCRFKREKPSLDTFENVELEERLRKSYQIMRMYQNLHQHVMNVDPKKSEDKKEKEELNENQDEMFNEKSISKIDQLMLGRYVRLQKREAKDTDAETKKEIHDFLQDMGCEDEKHEDPDSPTSFFFPRNEIFNLGQVDIVK